MNTYIFLAVILGLVIVPPLLVIGLSQWAENGINRAYRSSGVQRQVGRGNGSEGSDDLD